MVGKIESEVIAVLDFHVQKGNSPIHANILELSPRYEKNIRDVKTVIFTTNIFNKKA